MGFVILFIGLFALVLAFRVLSFLGVGGVLAIAAVALILLNWHTVVLVLIVATSASVLVASGLIGLRLARARRSRAELEQSEAPGEHWSVTRF